jgi:hypothetical protein
MGDPSLMLMGSFAVLLMEGGFACSRRCVRVIVLAR